MGYSNSLRVNLRASEGDPPKRRHRTRHLENGLLGDLVVTAAEELEEAKSMAEGVDHQCELAPRGSGDRGFELCAGVECVLNGGLDVVDHEVEVHGGPMTAVATRLCCGVGGGGTGCLQEEVDGSGATEHLDAMGAKATSRLEAKGGLIEMDGLGEVVDVDIGEELHGLRSFV